MVTVRVDPERISGGDCVSGFVGAAETEAEILDLKGFARGGRGRELGFERWEWREKAAAGRRRGGVVGLRRRKVV